MANNRVPIVTESGSGSCKAGFAGEDFPRTIFFPNISWSRNGTSFRRNKKGFSFVSFQSEDLEYEYPIKNGIINDIFKMWLIWDNIFHKKLDIDPTEHAVLLTESPLNTNSNRAWMTQIMFENFNVPAIYISNPAALSLFASGRSTGIVLDSGAEVTVAVPIHRGRIISNAIVSSNFAGKNMTEHLLKILSRNNDSLTEMDDRDACLIKEMYCSVALDFERENAFAASFRNTDWLQNGQEITIADVKHICPEALFQPSLCNVEVSGIHKMVYDSIQNCDGCIRKDLYENIILSGGNMLFPNIVERMQNEIEILARQHNNDCVVRVEAPHTWIRGYNGMSPNTAWYGGSLFASQPEFSDMCISRSEYYENGR